jgi:dTDP-4-amino-4,6-dideoxygalactose transaminase
MNAKMSELHAATALAVLDEYDGVLVRRRAIARRLRERAGDGIGWQLGCDRSTWQFVPIELEEHRRETLIRRAGERAVEIRSYYEPLHTLGPVRAVSVVDADLRRTDELHRRIVCLPMATDLDDSEVDLLAGLLADAA